MILIAFALAFILPVWLSWRLVLVMMPRHPVIAFMVVLVVLAVIGANSKPH